MENPVKSIREIVETHGRAFQRLDEAYVKMYGCAFQQSDGTHVVVGSHVLVGSHVARPCVFSTFHPNNIPPKPTIPPIKHNPLKRNPMKRKSKNQNKQDNG